MFANAVKSAVNSEQKKYKVVITVHDAAELRGTQMFGHQDPYCIAYMKGNPRKKVKTHVDEDGGHNPSWKRKLATLDYKRPDRSDTICFEIWNENSINDTLIGQAACHLSDLFNPAERPVSLPVTTKGARQGNSVLRVSAHFTDHKTVARHGAHILNAAVTSGATASAPPGSAQWDDSKSDPTTATTATTATGNSRFRAAVVKSTGPSVSVGTSGLGGRNSSFNSARTTGTGIGFRNGYTAKATIASTSNVAFAASRFRGGLSSTRATFPSGPTASVAPAYPVQATAQPVGYAQQPQQQMYPPQYQQPPQQQHQYQQPQQQYQPPPQQYQQSSNNSSFMNQMPRYQPSQQQQQPQYGQPAQSYNARPVVATSVSSSYPYQPPFAPPPVQPVAVQQPFCLPGQQPYRGQPVAASVSAYPVASNVVQPVAAYAVNAVNYR